MIFRVIQSRNEQFNKPKSSNMYKKQEQPPVKGKKEEKKVLN